MRRWMIATVAVLSAIAVGTVAAVLGDDPTTTAMEATTVTTNEPDGSTTVPTASSSTSSSTTSQVQSVSSTSTSSTVAATTTTSAVPTTTTVPAATTTTPTSGRWRPAPGTTWQWQLTGPIDSSVDVQMYDVDLFDVPASTVAALQAQGRRVVCYFSAGAWEDWRPDAGRFPADVLGESNGWPGERWLDIRRLDALAPIMRARLDLCASKGFDGVEPDNIDGFSNDTGFALTAADQLAYNRFLADEAHARGLSIGLKNDVEQAAELEPWFDWALNEQCYQYGECAALSVFIRNGKAVFHVEYDTPLETFCPTTSGLGFSSLRKRWELDSWRQACP